MNSVQDLSSGFSSTSVWRASKLPAAVAYTASQTRCGSSLPFRLGTSLMDFTTRYVVITVTTFSSDSSCSPQPAILTTMDITTDGFGFMLSIGDLSWVPFAYSLQARYLAFTPIDLGPTPTAVVLLVNFVGYYIFRAANGEKNDFRNGKNPKSWFHLRFQFVLWTEKNTDLEYLTTESGGKLITSGWWGRSRHPNYLCVPLSSTDRILMQMILAAVIS